MAKYNINLATDTGNPILSLNRNTYFTASRIVNGVGRIELHTTVDFPDEYLRRDQQLLVYRAAPGSVYRLFTVYFLRRWRRERKRGKKLTKMWGYCPNSLLARRIVVAREGSTNSLLTDYAGNIIKQLATDAEDDTIDPIPDAGTRAWPDFFVSPELDDGPILTLETAMLPLLGLTGGGVFNQIAKAAEAEGTPIYFDVVASTPSKNTTMFTLYTYVGQPGNDLTVGVVFDEARGTMRDPYIDEDYTRELTYVYAGGKGLEDDREIVQVYDTSTPPTYLASQWNRIEGFVDAVADDGDGVREQGRAYLLTKKAVLKAGGSIADTPSTRFGIHWWHGDRVRFRFLGEEFESIVRNTVLVKRGGKDTIKAKVENVS